MSLSLLIEPEDWPKYKNMYAQAAGFHQNQVNWGDGPQSFPCLVASFTEKSSMLLQPKRVVSCYIYVSDAQKLLDTAGSDAAIAYNGAQDAFNKAMMAHAMTLIELLVDTGIVKEDKYEKRFTKMLAKADQMGAEDLERMYRTKNPPSEPEGPGPDEPGPPGDLGFPGDDWEDADD